MSFKEKFESLKNTTKGRLISFGLILLINTAILYVPLGECLIIFLIPVATFGIQYLFGERKMKLFIIIGFVLLLITGLIISGLLAYSAFSYSPAPLEGSTADGTVILDNGKVAPRSGYGGQNFNYTVTYFDPGGLTGNATILVNIYSPSSGLSENYSMLPVDINATTGIEYYYEIALPEDIHYFRFIALDAMSTLAIATGSFTDQAGISWEQGPINLPATQFLIFGLASYVPLLIMIYLLFIMLYWWTQKARTYAPMPPPKPKKEEEEFTCSKCGADVPGDATKCPNCGEEFEEEEEEEKVPKEVAEKIEKGRLYCKVCNDNIKKGDMILGCQCGRYYHLRCADKIGRCPHCGTDFKEE